MRLLDELTSRFAVPNLTRGRMAVALAVAVAADALQIALLPVAWTFVQEFIDVVAMVVTVLLLGFHVLLLPTFVLEFIPLVDMLPTWTGCVIAVLALRARDQRAKDQRATRLPPVVEVTAAEQVPPKLSIGPAGQGTQGDRIQNR